MDDSVSRQAAVDAIKTSRYLVDAMEKIIRLPSAQSEIIRCKECGHWDMSWENVGEPNSCYCPMVDEVRGENWYCADAIRRANDDTNRI